MKKNDNDNQNQTQKADDTQESVHTVSIDESNADEIQVLKKQLEESQFSYKRALADYQNLEKRYEIDKKDFVKFATKGFVVKILGIVDDLEKARDHLKDQGLILTLKKLSDVLRQEGIEKIETQGKEFNIETMEALSLKAGEKDNIVVEETRAGYTMHGSVLRPAQVIVSKK